MREIWHKKRVYYILKFIPNHNQNSSGQSFVYILSSHIEQRTMLFHKKLEALVCTLPHLVTRIWVTSIWVISIWVIMNAAQVSFEVVFLVEILVTNGTGEVPWLAVNRFNVPFKVLWSGSAKEFPVAELTAEVFRSFCNWNLSGELNRYIYPI